ncbi:MAG: dTDP-4-dehydrorhamnose 3,5-epimerase [bacterium]|nr:dTDP-4-dehydrorhamnose 3,5-epimerase [bacterium]
MKKIGTGIPGLYIIEPQVFADDRGHFFEAHNASKCVALGIEPGIVQINQSFSKRGVVRGLHFQAPPFDQTKLVRCVRGRLFDVAVDIRRGSPTYGKWFGIELSDENKRMLYIPTGFAHGFSALTDCEMMYLCGRAGYQKTTEGGLRYDDADIGIDWPHEGAPIVNERDLAFPILQNFETPFVF